MLSKVITARFYQVNLGFFLTLLLLMFGIINGRDAMYLHYAIMKSMMDSWQFMGIAAVIWALYNFKCISFGLKEMNRPENSFLYQMQALNDNAQLAALLQCQLSVFAPALVYGMIACIIGFTGHHTAAAVVFTAFQAAMVVTGAVVYRYRLNNTWNRAAISLPYIELFRKKNFQSYLLHFAWNHRKGTLVVVKALSLLLLQILVAANSKRESKEAVCVLIMFLISGHSLLPLYFASFMENELSFLRNLPLPVLRRLSMYVGTYAVIFIPELLFLVWNTRQVLPLEVILSLYALAVSQSSLYTSMLYLPGITTERYTTIVFVIFFVTLLLLASLSLWPVFFAESALAIAIFCWRYWKFEMIIAKTE